MNSAHLHLVVNHVPVLGFLFSLLLLIVGFLMRSFDVKRIALLGMVLSAAFGVVAFLTGEPAEEIVEKLPTVSKAFLEQHESFAKTAMYVGVGAGLISLIGFLLSFRRAQSLYLWAIFSLIGGLISSGMFGYTAFLGGKVNHPEIRGGIVTSSGGEVEHEREEH